jgi:hypothetical protein
VCGTSTATLLTPIYLYTYIPIYLYTHIPIYPYTYIPLGGKVRLCVASQLPLHEVPRQRNDKRQVCLCIYVLLLLLCTILCTIYMYVCMYVYYCIYVTPWSPTPTKWQKTGIICGFNRCVSYRGCGFNRYFSIIKLGLIGL